jgi:hypothetical protein
MIRLALHRCGCIRRLDASEPAEPPVWRWVTLCPDHAGTPVRPRVPAEVPRYPVLREVA